jgi:DNA-binding transcriptional MerR regulator
MRIGELAALAGVTTRTVRHYHHIGLLPQAARQANGYREYGLRDAMRLGRIRRLTELGLTLDEVRDVLADEAGTELHEVLIELDAELARQAEGIRRRRARLAELLAGGLPPEGPVSAELTALFEEMARTAARGPGPEPRMAAKERELLALLDGSGSPGAREWLTLLVRTLGSDTAAMRRAYDIYARMDELAGAAVDDPRVAEVARAIAAALPADLMTDLVAEAGAGTADATAEDGFTAAFFADFAPAQAEAARQAIRLLGAREGERERAR